MVPSIRLAILLAHLLLSPSVQAAELLESSTKKACLREFADCGPAGASQLTDMIKVSCEAKRKENECDLHFENAKAEERKDFFSCESANDVCDQLEQNTTSLLFSCGAGVGGLLWDAVEGLVMLPASVVSAIQNMKLDQEGFKSCSDDYEAKITLLGEFKPKEMTKESIQRLSCPEVKKIVETKAAVILSKLEARRLDEATKAGNDALTIYDLKLSQPEIQALNYDKTTAGPLRRGQCLRPEAAAKLACRTMTQGLMTVTGAAGTAGTVHLVKKFMTPKPKVTMGGWFNHYELRKRSWEEQTEIIRERIAKAEAVLKDKGVEFEKLPDRYRDESGQLKFNETYHTQRSSREDRVPNGGGKIYRIKSVKPSKKQGPFVPALEHADMAKHLKELQKDGYELVVDSSIGMEGTLGLHKVGRISIQPDTPWHVFKHEYTHQLVAKHIESDFPNLMIQVANGKSLSTLLSKEAKGAFSASQLKEMEKLMRARVGQNTRSGKPSSLAVHERMATLTELEEMGWRPLSTSKLSSERYGLEFAQKYLKGQSDLGPLPELQAKTLGEINQRINKLEQQEKNIEKIKAEAATLKSSAGAIAAGVAAEVGFAGNIGLGKELYYNREKKLIIAIDPETNEWKVIKGK